jgi:hypothetical protein
MFKASNLMIRNYAIILTCAMFPSISNAQTVYFESFENPAFAFDGTNTTGWGWYDWDLVQNGTGGSIGTISSTGAVEGTRALKLEPAGVNFTQGLAFGLQGMSNDTARRTQALQGLLNNTHISFEVTWDNADWIFGGSGWNGSQVQLDLNYGPGGTYQGQGFPDIDTGNPTTTGHWDNTNYPGVHTRTVSWDYSAHLPAIQALNTSGALNETAGWFQFNISTNAGNYSYPVAYYFDNFRFETPSAGTPGDFDDDDDVDGRDFLLWQRGLSTTGPLDAGDLEDWQANYGTQPPLAAATAVPEPASMILLATAALAMLHRKPTVH